MRSYSYLNKRLAVRDILKLPDTFQADFYNDPWYAAQNNLIVNDRLLPLVLDIQYKLQEDGNDEISILRFIAQDLRGNSDPSYFARAKYAIAFEDVCTVFVCSEDDLTKRLKEADLFDHTGFMTVPRPFTRLFVADHPTFSRFPELNYGRSRRETFDNVEYFSKMKQS
jgi:hypothetical protein